MFGHVFRRSSALHCNAGWPACHLGGAAGVLPFRLFTTVSSVRSDDIRFFCSGLLDCGSLSTCVLTSRFSGWYAVTVTARPKLTSRHVSPSQTTFCGTFFTRTEYPYTTQMSPGLVLVVYPPQQPTQHYRFLSRSCPTQLGQSPTAIWLRTVKGSQPHIAMQSAISLAQSDTPTTLIIAVHRCPPNKVTGSDPVLPTF